MTSYPSRPLQLVAGLAIVAAVAVGCGSSDSSSSDAESKGKTATITLLAPTVYQKAYPPLIEEFERAHPNIKVNDRYVPSQNIAPLITTQLRAGNAPDIFPPQPSRVNQVGVWNLAEADRLLPLSGPWVDSLPGPLKELLSWEGKVYASSIVNNIFGVIYNVDLLKELDLQTPTSFADVLSMCKTITAAGKVPIGQNMDFPGSQVVGGFLYGQYVYGPDPDWNKKRTDGGETFAGSPLWQSALKAFVDMRDAKCFQRGSETATFEQANALMTQGKSVMEILASPSVPLIKAANPKLNVAWMNFPSDGQHAISYSPQNIGVNAATKHPDEAKEFVNFISQSDVTTRFAESVGGLSTDDMKNAVVRDDMKELEPLLKEDRTRALGSYGWPTGVAEEAYVPGVTGLVTGQTKPDGVLKSMDAKWDQGAK